MGHFVERGKFVICSSLFKRIPSDFLTMETSLVAPVAILASSFRISLSSCFS